MIFEVCDRLESLQQDTTCVGQPFWFAGQWLDQPGIYRDTLATAAGCDSVIRLDLALASPQTGVTLSDTALTALAQGATYQWLDCAAGDTALPGATEQTYFPTRSGAYAVVVGQYGCFDTSACVAFVRTRLEAPLSPGCTLLPNPSHGQVLLRFDRPQAWAKVRVLDPTGRPAAHYAWQQVQEAPLTLALPAGLYLLEVSTPTGTLHLKHLIQP